MSCTRHNEIREVLRQRAKHPHKIDRLTDAELERLGVQLTLNIVRANLTLQTLCEEMGERAKEINSMLSVPELD